jgi:cytochrome c556
MKPTVWLAAATMVCLVGTARADAPSSSDNIVAGRKAAFALSSVVFGGMRPAIEAGGDVKPLTRGARVMNRWAKALPGLFPPGSTNATSGAAPAVWSDWPGFTKAAANYAEATAKLADLASANDKAGFAAQYKVVGAACDDCHKTYRLPENH